MPAVAEVEEYRRGNLPFVPFTRVRERIESIVNGQVTSTPFTTFYDLFDEDQDTPRLHLFSSKTYPSRTSEPFLFRRPELDPSCQDFPQVTFAGILAEDDTKKIGVYILQESISDRNEGFNYTVYSNTPGTIDTISIPDDLTQTGKIDITYLEYVNQTFVLRCGEQIFMMASLDTQRLGIKIAVLPNIIMGTSTSPGFGI